MESSLVESYIFLGIFPMLFAVTHLLNGVRPSDKGEPCRNGYAIYFRTCHCRYFFIEFPNLRLLLLFFKLAKILTLKARILKKKQGSGKDSCQPSLGAGLSL